MPRPFHFLALSALLTVVYSDCTIDDLTRCGPLTVNYLNDLVLLQWDKDIAKLNERCSTGKSYFDCVDNVRKDCNIPNIPNDPLPELKKFRDRLCTADSDLQKKYLKSGQCLEGKSTVIHGACQTPAAPHYNADFVIPEEVKKEMCKGYRTFPCLYSKIEELCGKDARSVFEEFTNPEVTMMNALCGSAYGLASFNWVLAAGLLILASLYST